MPLLRVAIVGRPNVGKSSLLNMLAKAKVSIVDPTPGVTRDRVSTVLEIPAPDDRGVTKVAEVIDTGGYGVYVADGARFNEVGEDLASLTPHIESQIASAVRSADLVLFVIDAQAGVTAADREIAEMLRRGSFGRGRPPAKARGAEPQAPVVVVANKVDDSSWEPHAADAAALGFGPPLLVSAATNYLRRGFVDRLWTLLPDAPRRAAEQPADEPALKFVILGKRNAGKSTIVNALAGEERVIVSEIAGTTRDAVDVRFERDGKIFVAIDTAGFRKKKSLAGQVEWWAMDRARRALLRADAALFVIDATTPVSQIDKQLSLEIQRAFKPCVIVVNKWDLVQGRRTPTGKAVTTDDYRDYLDKELSGLHFCPIVFTSAAAGAEQGGVWDALGTARELHEHAGMRVGTGELNRALRPAMDRMPASKLGRKLKILFASQVETRPPTIVLVVNNPDLLTPRHARFILNRLRECTPFAEVPMRLLVRGRRRDEAVQEGDTMPASAAVPVAASVDAIDAEEFDLVDLAEDAGVHASEAIDADAEPDESIVEDAVNTPASRPAAKPTRSPRMPAPKPIRPVGPKDKRATARKVNKPVASRQTHTGVNKAKDRKHVDSKRGRSRSTKKPR